MRVTIQRQESRWVIGLEGQITLASAAELQELLLEWLAAGKDLELDLEGAEEIDVTIMQLFWAAAREARRAGVGIAARASREAAAAVRECGFASLPGFPVQGDP